MVSEEKIFEIVNNGRTDDGQTDDGRTPEHGYTISSPVSLRLRWDKNMGQLFSHEECVNENSKPNHSPVKSFKFHWKVENQSKFQNSLIVFMSPTFAPNFEKVGRAYCFWLVCVSVCLSVCVCVSVNFWTVNARVLKFHSEFCQNLMESSQNLIRSSTPQSQPVCQIWRL